MSPSTYLRLASACFLLCAMIVLYLSLTARSSTTRIVGLTCSIGLIFVGLMVCVEFLRAYAEEQG
jgi:multisubunit Na+/H+ antiporter MnhF subunit